MTTTLIRNASDAAPAARATSPGFYVAAIIAAWFVAALVLGRAGAFESGPAQPPLSVLGAVAIPPLLFALAYRVSPAMRAFALGIDLRMLTAIEAWRIGGILFLALYAFGQLPSAFAWPAGAGDTAVGIAAIFVLGALLRNSPHANRYVFWLNIAGLVDFAGAIGTGVLTSNSALGLLHDGASYASLGSLPLSLIPTFAVPFWIICHTISLLQISKQ